MMSHDEIQASSLEPHLKSMLMHIASYDQGWIDEEELRTCLKVDLSIQVKI